MLRLEDPLLGLGAKPTEKGNTPTDSSGGKSGSGSTGPDPLWDIYGVWTRENTIHVYPNHIILQHGHYSWHW